MLIAFHIGSVALVSQFSRLAYPPDHTTSTHSFRVTASVVVTAPHHGMSAALPSSDALSSASPAEILHLGARLGRTDLVMSSLAAGAPITAKDETTTPLHSAVKAGHVDVVRALLAAGALLCVRDADGVTPVEMARDNPALTALFVEFLCQRAAADDVPAITDAVNAGVQLNEPDSLLTGNTPLHWAAEFGSCAALRQLLKWQATVDVRNAKGITPLMDAARSGQYEAAELLLEAGANPNLEATLGSMKGKSALQLAGMERLKRLLQNGQSLLPSAHSQETVKPLDDSQQTNCNDLESSQEATLHATATSPTSPATPHISHGANTNSKSTPSKQELPAWADLLWPRPQRSLFDCEAQFVFPPQIVVSANHDCISTATMLSEWLQAQPVLREYKHKVRAVRARPSEAARTRQIATEIGLSVDPNVVEGAQQAYRLTVRETGVTIVGSDMAGLFYGCATFEQLIRLRLDAAGAAEALTVPTCAISDWPAIKTRAVLLEFSAHAVPKLATLKALIRKMAVRFKLNHLYIDFGGNFGPQLQSGQASSGIAHEDLLELNAFCDKFHMQLVPSLNLHGKRKPETSDSNGAQRNAAATLSLSSTKPGGDDFVSGEEWRDVEEYLLQFSSSQVHISDMGLTTPTTSDDAMRRLRSVADATNTAEKPTIHFPASAVVDALRSQQERVGVFHQLPAQGVAHVVAQHSPRLWSDCLVLAKTGVPFYISVSSQTCFTIAGCVTSCIELIQLGVEAATGTGACGCLLQHACSSRQVSPMVLLWYSVIPFSGSTWNADSSIRFGASGSEPYLSNLLDVHVFNDAPAAGVLGSVMVALSDLHRTINDERGSKLYDILVGGADNCNQEQDLSYAGLRRVMRRSERAEGTLQAYKGRAAAPDLVELKLCAVLLNVAATLGALRISTGSLKAFEVSGALNSGKPYIASLPDGRRSDLCNDLLKAIDFLRQSWMERYSPTGFVETVSTTLEPLLTRLAAGMPFNQFLTDRKRQAWVPYD